MAGSKRPKKTQLLGLDMSAESPEDRVTKLAASYHKTSQVLKAPVVRSELEERTTEEVFMDHLELRKAGRLADDIARNYAEDVMIVSNFGTFFGHAGVHQSATLLRLLLPTLAYKFDSLLVRGTITFEEWEAETDEVVVRDGIDAFVIKEGKIRVQTIFYLPEPKKKPRKSKKKAAARKR